MVEFARPFIAMRKDPRWLRKIALGALINLIPYFGMVAVVGWSVEYLRRVAWGEDERLPEWSGIGKHALRGLWAFVAVLPYSLVAGVISTPIILAVVFGSTASLVAGVAASGGEPFGGLTPWWFVGIVAATVVPTFVLSYAITPISFGAMTRVALYDRLEAGFEFAEIWARMKTSRSTLLRAWGFSALLGVLVTLPMTAVAFVPMAVSMSMIGAGARGDATALVAPLLLMVAMPVVYAALSLVGMVTGVASYHYWGRHAAAAYALEPAAGATPAAATAPAPEPAIQPEA
jgi:hypothetical protein